MKIAIFSDVHGNLTALEAVLVDIDRQSPDAIVFAGDLCLMGARPSACINLLQARKDILAIHGNTDLAIGQPLTPPVDADEATKTRYHEFNLKSEWTRAQLSDGEYAWLCDMPFSLRLSPTSSANDDLLIVHANPKDVDRPILPPDEVQQQRFGKVSQSQPDEELEPLLADVTAAVIAYGHVHLPNIRQWRGMTLANISSVSIPMDADTRAKYGVLTWADGRWHISHYAIEYDLAAEQAIISQIQPPGWEWMAKSLLGRP
ncbi:MAG TPA: metallophosphoesterase family protein [Chloroflexota bacterium]|nr:metallophosphoesterase family protein [Chloroflexota bacterium]HUM71764.1 metallophosphoesterase family protein [Chloroflexota bacterium]